MAEFKLGRLRFVWQGNWTTGTAYVKDDVVRISGKSYVCVVGHTASTNFITDLNAVPTKWNLVADGSTWTGTWNNSTYYNTNDLVKYGGVVYICNTPHQSVPASITLTTTGASASNGTATLSFNSSFTINGTVYANAVQPFLVGATIVVSGFSSAANFNGTFTVTACTTTSVSYALIGSYTDTVGTITGTAQSGLEASLSNWTTYATSMNWIGNWSINTRYKDNDVIKYGGETYVCNTGHVSANTVLLGLEANQSNWTLFADGFNWETAWSNGVHYKLNDVVTYGGYVYVCNTPHISAASSLTLTSTNFVLNANVATATFAQQVIPPYAVGSTITLAGFSPLTTSGSVNNVNASFTVTACTTTTVSFALTGTYTVVVEGTITGTSQLGLENDQSKWDYFHKGFNYIAGGWQPDTRYKINDIVNYAGTAGSTGGDTWICTTAHTSTGSFVQTNWARFVEGLTYYNTWSNTTVYTPGDLVTYGGFSYIATSVVPAGTVPPTDVSSPTTLNITNATSTASVVTLTFATQSSIPFQAGQTITVSGMSPSAYNGQYVVTGIPSTTQVQYLINDGPIGAYSILGTVASNNWALYTTGFTLIGDWSNATAYQVGDVVRLGGYTYLCIVNNSATQPPNTTYWSKLNSGVRWNAPGLSYTGLTTTNVTVTNGAAAGATFSVSTSGTTYSLTKTANGTNYTNGDIIKILGTSVGGISPFNDITITVLTTSTGAISTFSSTGYAVTWASGTQYVAGDAVAYGPNSYICILAHTGATGNRPDNDITGTYWNTLVAGASTSILTTTGDIAYYGPGGATRLPIGASGQVLKVSNSGYPSWGYFGIVTDVYYVSSTNGVDSPAPGYGTTLDRPWKTIAYAAKQVYNGTYFPNTSNLLTRNKAWLIAEMYNWMNYEKQNSVTPFTTGSTYDPYKTQRDAGYVVDAVIYDLTRGGNSQTVAAALAYFQQGSTNTFYDTAVASEVAFFIASLNFLSGLMTSNAITNTAPATIYQNSTGLYSGTAKLTTLAITGASGLNGQVTFTFATQTNSPFVVGEVITISSVSPGAYNGTYTVLSMTTNSVTVSSTVTSTYVSGGNIAGSLISQTIDSNYSAETGAGSAITTLMSIITTALTNQSTASIPAANTGTTSTIFIKTGTYNEVLPIIVPENCALVGDELRGVIVQPFGTTATFSATISNTTLTASAMTAILSSQGITATASGTYGSTGTGGVVTVASTSTLSTGHIIVVTGSGGGGIAAGTYYVGSVLTATTMTLATSWANALAGTYITLSSGSISGTTFTAYGSIIVGMFVNGTGISAPLQVTAQLTGATGTAVTSSTASGSSGSFTITLTSSNGAIAVGQFVSGNGATIGAIPTNTFVTAVNGTTVTLSNELVSTLTSTTVYFFTPGQTGTYTLNSTVVSQLTLSISSETMTAGYVSGNMFYVRNGSGVRNMTLYGLTGSKGTPVTISSGSITATTAGTFGTTNTGGSITVASTAGMAPGNTFVVSGSGGNGLSATTYYIGSVLNGTTLTLSTTYNLSLAGTYITLTSGSISGTTYASNYGTARPTGGAYVSLDPGTGPSDTSAWIFRKSPYVQNVTTFGTGCVGCKVDGTLHNGGNRSIVANDFTQVLSDGIGFWLYGPGALAELVSVFTYYNQIGYLSEAGGKMRATNGNCSYGSYGVVAEGYDLTEVPVTAVVNNRYTGPIISNVVTDSLNTVYRVEFTNAGSAANTATFSFASSGGYGLTSVGNEFRDNAVFETRWLTGGANYMTAANTGQSGTTNSFTIAAVDTNISSVYQGMRLLVTGGTGVGQTGFIAYYNNGSKIAQMAKESFTPLAITGSVNATASATSIISGTSLIPTGTVTGAFVPGMYLSSGGTVTAGTYITQLNTGSITTGSFGNTTISSTGTVGSITGTGPWTATITGMSTTAGLFVGSPITATSGSGTLYGGSPTSVVVASIVSTTSITYTVTGGTTPTAGTITNVNTPVLLASAGSSNIASNAILSGGGTTAGTYVKGMISSNATAVVTATFTGTSGTNTITLSSFTVGSITSVSLGQFVSGTSSTTNIAIPAGTFVTAINVFTNVITISNNLIGALSASCSIYPAGTAGTYAISNSATGTPTASTQYVINISQNQVSATVTGTQNTLTASSTATLYNGMPLYLSAQVGITTSTTTLYYAVGVTTGPGATNFSLGTTSTATTPVTVSGTSGLSGTYVWAAGWDHVVPGTPIKANLDVTSTYIIEPRLTYTSPGFTPTAGTVTSATWIDCIYGDLNATYSTISATGGTGTSATFTVVKTGIAYAVTQVSGGSNYTIGDTLTIAGTSLGGLAPANNVTITVTNVGTLNTITNFTFTGAGAGGIYVAVTNNSQTAGYSTNGTTWTVGSTMPASSNWTSVTAGAVSGTTTWVAVQNGSNNCAVSTNGTSWTAGGSLGVAVNWSSVAYGNGYFVAIQSGGTNMVYSANPAVSWSAGSGLPSSTTWSSVAYGNGVWVAIAYGGTTSAYSTNVNASTWVASGGLPSNQYWTSVTFGKGKFVAVAAQSNVSAYSFNGITWYASTFNLPSVQTWNKVRYGQGLFFATNTDATTLVATSEDGLFWTAQTMTAGSAGGWPAVAFGNPNSVPLWIALTNSTTVAESIVTGCTAQGRAAVTLATGVTGFRMVEPGSGYASTPTMTITDPNQTTAATWTVRVGTGAVANPTYTNRGTSYATASATVSTNGYADIYQPGSYINVSGLTVNPTAGSNVLFAGNSNVYKLVQVTNYLGTGSGIAPYTAQFQINPALTTSNAPTNGTAITLRLKYSQVRLTGHDFLSIGTGNFVNTNYPGTPFIAANSNYQTVSNNGGRVFFTSTDQDGNFNVGNLFSVQQATGVTTLNASAFNVAGLNSLTIGAVSLGTNSATITQFSTDPYFTANSDNILPTQKAIKSYITSQIGGGGSTLNVNTLTAGIIYIAGNTITTTTGGQIKVSNKMYFVGGIDGQPLAMNFLLLN